MNENIARVISNGGGHEEITASATECGMSTLWQDGLGKAALGVTTIEEISRVVR
jgi:type II secretory ATPase GspE/PulE/Tfp pilus assembly ATPase PilB-like protein